MPEEHELQLSEMPLPISPCIDVCVVDPATGLCIGCYRTLDEIARWGALGRVERMTIMADLARRAPSGRLADMEL